MFYIQNLCYNSITMKRMRQGPTKTTDNPAQTLSSVVGRRIKKIRKARNMSLAVLSDLTGLGKGTLSEIERGLRNPTLDTLFAITTAFHVPLSSVLIDNMDFLSGISSSPAHGSSVDARLLARWDEDTGTREVYRITINETLQKSDPHAPGVRENLILLTGFAEVGNTDNLLQLKEGGSVCFDGDKPHQYRSLDGKATAVLIMFYPDLNA
ncbi:hypothetical transcriptional regulator [Sporolactobacillus putidus]|uniref:Hypothetical transcriptional regulator n=2 Tax=Sporolactobacillus putidus TaxID=492735 RepID=A0A917S1U0_9BACL|nr:hypothetical transcriptional regulator [Sporolactobacillus putidus]